MQHVGGSHAIAIARRLRAPERLCEKRGMWRPRSAAEPVARDLTARPRQLGYEKEALVLDPPPAVDAEVDEYLSILMRL